MPFPRPREPVPLLSGEAGRLRLSVASARLFRPPEWGADPSTSPLPSPSPSPATRLASVAPRRWSADLDRVLEEVCQAIRTRHYSPRTEKAYLFWARRFIHFGHFAHPRALGAPDVRAFLARLATGGNVSASTQNQAFSALLFLYREVLRTPLVGLEDTVRAKRAQRLPLVLGRHDVAAILSHLRGPVWLMASLMYGSGLRLLECARLRVKDVDLDRGEILVRDGKGRKDRVTVLPSSLIAPLRAQLERGRRQHGADLSGAIAGVALPAALAVKYPRASTDWVK